MEGPDRNETGPQPVPNTKAKGDEAKAAGDDVNPTNGEIPIHMGDRIADKATGVQGVLTAMCVYVGGHKQFQMSYAGEDSVIRTIWLDQSRLAPLPGQ